MVLVRQMPETSHTARAVHGEDAAWSLGDHLLAHIADLLAGANWQRAGDKAVPRPKPLPRPGVGPKRLTLSGSEVQRRLLAQRDK